MSKVRSSGNDLSQLGDVSFTPLPYKSNSEKEQRDEVHTVPFGQESYSQANFENRVIDVPIAHRSKDRSVQ